MEFEIIPVTRYEQNCSILWCEETMRAAIIDPGGDIGAILTTIDLLEVEPEIILITHGHADHCGGAARLAKQTGARIEGPHKNEAPVIRHVGTGAYDEKNTQPYTPARWLSDGDICRFGNEHLLALHCPGHSPGHMAYFSPAARWAFVGDILFRGAIGAWEHPGGNLALLVQSITQKLFPLGEDVRFVPGHGETSTFGYERETNPFVGKEAMRRWERRFSSS